MNNDDLILQISKCIESGKVNKDSPYPPDMRGMDGADELTRQALSQGIPPSLLLNEALIKAMHKVGQLFSEKKIFVPQMLISAKAMNAALVHLKPYFMSGEVKRKGRFIIGTVTGDLHDIGKNLVAMIVEGAGWEVIDVGVDAGAKKFSDAMENYPDSVVGLSALLTTTMVNMKSIINELKSKYPQTRIIIGGAPISEAFRAEAGADAYARDPQGAVAYLNSL